MAAQHPHAHVSGPVVTPLLCFVELFCCLSCIIDSRFSLCVCVQVLHPTPVVPAHRPMSNAASDSRLSTDTTGFAKSVFNHATQISQGKAGDVPSFGMKSFHRAVSRCRVRLSFRSVGLPHPLSLVVEEAWLFTVLLFVSLLALFCFRSGLCP